MSREELVGAFLEGRLSRRTLIRRLVAGGVSTGAAVSYAQLLAPEQAAATVTPTGLADDHYPMVDMKVVTPRLSTVKNQAKIKVNVSTTEELGGTFFRVFLKQSGGGIPVGSRFYSDFLGAGGSRDAVIPLDTSSFASRSVARFYVHLQSNDAEGWPALGTTAKTLR